MKVTVRILKAKNDRLWYRNKIGQEFKVKPVKGSKHPKYEMKTGENTFKIIYAEDCEEIT